MSASPHATIHHGDCIEVMRGMADNSIDAIVCDPPYNLSFMGRGWDTHASAEAFQKWCQQWATEALRILKPGGHLLAFGGTRTWHRLAVAIEDAGFEIRDSIAWLYGSGFPKSLDVSKAIDKAAGAEREVVGDKLDRPGYHLHGHDSGTGAFGKGIASTTAATRLASAQITDPATDAARQWAGFGTALKPAFEPCVMARKPLIGTVASNVTTWGTGALNIDGCRIGMSDADRAVVDNRSGAGFGTGDTVGANQGRAEGKFTSAPAGRWPTNVALDQHQADALDQQSGITKDGVTSPKAHGFRSEYVSGAGSATEIAAHPGYGGGGGASRFMYVAKAPKSERPVVDGIAHPTVKPLSLMRWLVRLVTPPGGRVLDPFAGSGTTVEAAIQEGFDVIGIEREADYLPLIQARIDRSAMPATHEPPSLAVPLSPPADRPLRRRSKAPDPAQPSLFEEESA